MLRHYGNIAKIAKDNCQVAPAVGHLRGIWIWGSTGLGKSKAVNDSFDSIYPKLANKWWDGYKGEKIILMDDIDERHECLGHHLKIWTDHYGFIGEVKGGAVTPRYDWFIVTSNCNISTIFKNPRDLEPLMRRFRIIHADDHPEDISSYEYIK